MSCKRDNGTSTAEDSTLVELNVGGVKYSTSMFTLRSDPDSMLRVMFEERWSEAVSKQPEKQSAEEGDKSGGEEPLVPVVFIDRDGSNFRYILNYLRNDVNVALPKEDLQLRELLLEADFYQLKGLKSLIESKLDFISQITKGGFVFWKPDVCDRFWKHLYYMLYPAQRSAVKELCVLCGREWDSYYRCTAAVDIGDSGYTKDRMLFLMKQMRGIAVELYGGTCCDVDWSDGKSNMHLPLAAVVPAE